MGGCAGCACNTCRGSHSAIFRYPTIAASRQPAFILRKLAGQWQDRMVRRKKWGEVPWCNGTLGAFDVTNYVVHKKRVYFKVPNTTQLYRHICLYPNVKPHSPCLWHDSAAQMCALKRHGMSRSTSTESKIRTDKNPQLALSNFEWKSLWKDTASMKHWSSMEVLGVVVWLSKCRKAVSMVCQIHASRNGGPYVSCSMNFFITSTDSGRNSTCFWLRDEIRDPTVADNLCMYDVCRQVGR